MILAQLGVALVQLVERLVASQTPLVLDAHADAHASVSTAASGRGLWCNRIVVKALRGCQSAVAGVGLAARGDGVSWSQSHDNGFWFWSQGE